MIFIPFQTDSSILFESFRLQFVSIEFTIFVSVAGCDVVPFRKKNK